MKINRQDTNGVKPLLQTGELGFDNFASGGDKGRVYVGNGASNIALAKKSEVDAKVVANVNITAGTYKSVTVDVKGLVTGGTNPTTVAGYGITDAQSTLVSGTNIKTVNSSSILGSGNLALLASINPVITGSITEQVYNLTGTAINPANGTIQYKTVSANTTFTETLTSGQSVLLRLIGASNYTIIFPTITWVGAVAPTLTANCAIALWKEQSTLYGSFVGTLV